jgi:hypothetical protein
MSGETVCDPSDQQVPGDSGTERCDETSTRDMVYLVALECLSAVHTNRADSACPGKSTRAHNTTQPDTRSHPTFLLLRSGAYIRTFFITELIFTQ